MKNKILSPVLIFAVLFSSLFASCDEALTHGPAATGTDSETAAATNAPDDGTAEDNLVTGEYIITADSSTDGIVMGTRDVFADTWVSTDALGRVTLEGKDTRSPTGGDVGIFYYLWRDREQDSVSMIPASDHYAAYLEGGVEKLKEVMLEGGEGHPHYWAEPYFGYYSSNDEWVLRRHAYMLADAGVDFVFFDITNNNIHRTSFMALMKVWTEMQNEGVNVPRVCFLCGAYDGEFNELYQTVYKAGIYKNLWYYWEGKPLVMLSGDVNMTKEQKEFFTVRYSWAVGASNWYTEKKGLCCWPWADDFRQAVGYGETKDDKEQCVVMCGYWATNGVLGSIAGRSYSNKSMPRGEGDWDFGYALMETTTGQGLAFAEQFEYALVRDTPVIMITGWNEWIAGRWSGAGAGAAGQGQILAGEYRVTNDPDSYTSTYFVDQFNPEFSRDIEPMKGGFGDNYLYQMAQLVRRYKGSRNVEAAFGSPEGELSLADDTRWDTVGPEYRDYYNDTTERISPGHVGGCDHGMYVNFSGRNDIITCKVAKSGTYVSFMAECSDAITKPEGENWMNLFVNTDRDDSTGWHGYDILINRAQKGSYCSVDRFTGCDKWELENVGSAKFDVCENRIVITVSAEVLTLGGEFEFKWADNSLPTRDIMEFLDMGDAAPSGRYNYLYTETEQMVKLPDCLTEDMIVLKSGSYNAFYCKESIRLGEGTRHITVASGKEIYLPREFARDILGITDGEVYIYNGIEYVRADIQLDEMGKKISYTQDGLIVIADEEITDADILQMLYRSLT